MLLGRSAIPLAMLPAGKIGYGWQKAPNAPCRIHVAWSCGEGVGIVGIKGEQVRQAAT
jgi:hypothetical protein